MIKNIFTVLYVIAFLSFYQLAHAFPYFSQYVLIYGKNYTAEEYLVRQKIYNQTVESFKLITDYTPGVNQMTDWTQQQLKQRKSLQQLPVQAQNAAQLPVKLASNRLGAPSSLDWKTRNAVTSIKNQGSCGCCWSFASIAYVQSRLIIQGKYTIDNLDLSEQYLLKCTKYSDCSGGYLEYAIEQVKVVPTEQEYPYNPFGINLDICSAKGIRTGYIHYNYYSLTDSQLIDLLQEGPVPISISSQDWNKYGSGIFKCSLGASVDHAVLLVGYTETYWIVKNQWGENWGEKGYIRVSRDRNYNCKIGQSAHVLQSGRLYLCVISACVLFLGIIL